MESLKTLFGRNLRGDIYGGITSAVVALPLALAFGVASGAGAAAGLYSAIFTGILATIFGGTPAQITGPTGAMTVVLVEVYREFGLDGLFLSMILCGLLQVVFSFLKLGDYIHYIPHPVVAGFTNGIGILIFYQQFGTFQYGPALALGTMAIMFLLPRLTRAVPGSLAALIATTLLVYLASFDTKLIGEIPRGLPALKIPVLSFEGLIGLIRPAFILALLGSMESLLAAVVVDEMAGTKHKPNQELFGQGIGNLVAPLFGGIAGTGAIVRSAVNVRSGGRTQLSGILHGLLILAFTVSLGGLVSVIPMATLAGILMMTALGMIDWESLRDLKRAPKSDSAAMLLTCFLTVTHDLVVGVVGGLALSTLMFTIRMTKINMGSARIPLPGGEASSSVSVIEVRGPLFFGASKRFTELAGGCCDESFACVADLSHVNVIDATGAADLRKMQRQARERGRRLVLAALQEKPKGVLGRLGVLDEYGPDGVYDSVDQALAGLARIAAENGSREIAAGI